jgi:membrane-bound lytic murein transglycosylase D
MQRATLSPLLLAAAVFGLGACAGAQGRDPVSAPVPVHPAGAEQLGEEPRIDDAPPAAVAPSLLGTARYDLPVEANEWVQGELTFLTTQRHEVIGTWLQRADYYQPWVKEVFAAAGVPQDLSHLGMVESGYLPTARSHAGAVGMWQFMAGTGRGMGLRVDEIVDERMDPVRSTRAAARHLRDLNQAFNGDWALAIAAYNAGSGRISRGLRQYNARNFWELAQAGDLAEETKRYVPRLYAVTIVAHEPSRFGYAAPAGPVRRFEFDSVRVDVMTPLSQLAETGGVPLGDLVELNPHLVRGTAPADYWVWTPKGTGAAVQQAFNTSDFRRNGGYGYYVIRRGDDVVKLATAAGLSTDQVRAMNPRLDSLVPGQRLVFPVGVATTLAGRPVERVATDDSDRTTRRRSSSNGNRAGNNGNGNNASGDDGSSDGSDDSSSSSRSSRSSAPADRPARSTSSDRAASSDAGDRPSRAGRSDDDERPSRESPRLRTFEHTVKRGETLASLAERFDVPPSRIVAINELESRRLRPGQTLRIPRPADEQPSRSTTSSDDDAPQLFVHTVVRGETLAGLAERFEVTPARIRALNDMEAGARVRPGQKLRIPRNAETRSARSGDDDVPARTSRPSRGSESASSSRSSSRSGDDDAPSPRTFEHTVTRGETLASLSERFDVPPSRIVAINELESRRLRPGQKLRIPRAAEPERTAARHVSSSTGDGDDDGPSTRRRSSDGESSSRRSSDTESSSRRSSDSESSTRRRSSDGESSSRRSSDGETSSARRKPSDSDDGDSRPSRSSSASSDRSRSGSSSERSSSSSSRSSSDRSASSDRSSGDHSASSRRPDGERSSSAGERRSSERSASSERSSSDRPSSERSSGQSRRSGEGTSSRARYTEHTVKAGETLYSLARRYSVTVAQIRGANDLDEGASLSIGRKLRIPQASQD